MPLTRDLPNFKLSEFQHPELVEERAAAFLQAVRSLYGAPLYVTSDARTEEENAAIPDAAPSSLHLAGQAFDLASLPDVHAQARFAAACFYVAALHNVTFELGIYAGPNAHIHLGVRWDNTPTRLYVKHRVT